LPSIELGQQYVEADRGVFVIAWTHAHSNNPMQGGSEKVGKWESYGRVGSTQEREHGGGT
jgi:hypothetical protein